MNLIKVFYKKEVKFWKKIGQLRKKLTWIGFGIAALLLIIQRICILLISFLFECFLWIFDKKQFKINILRLQKI